MLRTMADLEDYSVAATDGSVGRVQDFYLDDELWIVRYFLVDTGAWLAKRQVLISTQSIRAPNWFNRLLPVSMTRLEVAESPDIDTSGPEHHDHHLRSCRTVISSRIRAPAGDVGHICGFLIDDENWAIRYLIVDTRNWWLGHRVLIAPEWIESVSWDNHRVSLKLTREAVRNAPPYHAKTQVVRDAEIKLHDHYGLPGYWAGSVEPPRPEFRYGA